MLCFVSQNFDVKRIECFVMNLLQTTHGIVREESSRTKEESRGHPAPCSKNCAV
jgi:hypothetical protein